MSLPTDSAARKRIPMFSGLLVYFPDALAAVAEHSFDSNEKHNPGEPVHWSREKSSDHMDCIVRHMTDIAAGADKIAELKAVVWRGLAELQLALEAKVKDQKPVDGVCYHRRFTSDRTIDICYDCGATRYSQSRDKTWRHGSFG